MPPTKTKRLIKPITDEPRHHVDFDFGAVKFRGSGTLGVLAVIIAVFGLYGVVLLVRTAFA